MVQQVLNGLKEEFNRWRFHNALRCIRNTPPITLGDSPFTLLSMVHHRDVELYLLAVKSFVRFLQPHRIVVVLDSSITETDKELLRQHVYGIDLYAAETFRNEGIPFGGCWERICAIANYVVSDYVVQLDADTVTLDYPSEVVEAIKNETSFVLSPGDKHDIETCQSIASMARIWLPSSGHVQMLAESVLDRLSNHENLRYVRGCAGFTGFAIKSFDMTRLRRLSEQMYSLIGKRWSEWGTEQFASNFMVANSSKAIVLPHPKYCNSLREQPGTIFLHFIGYMRFKNNRYTEVARRVCNSLCS